MPRGRPKHPDILTPREWQVLDLIREGLTNEQIARRLGISENGAKYHVLEILSKLGVSSRYEAAAWRREREPAAASRRFAGVAALFALRPKLSAVTASKTIATALVVSAVGFMAVLAIGVLVMNQRASGAKVTPEPTSEAAVAETAAAAVRTPTPTPTPNETATKEALEAAKGLVPPPANLTMTPAPSVSSTGLFMEDLPPSVHAALDDFAASEGTSYAGPCSTSTQAGQLCMTNVTPDASGKAMDIELRVSGELLAYGVSLVPNGAGGYQIDAATGPEPFSLTPPNATP